MFYEYTKCINLFSFLLNSKKFRYYPTILNTFSQVVTKEQRSKVLDNVYGALARMIITHIEGVPLDHVNIIK